MLRVFLSCQIKVSPDIFSIRGLKVDNLTFRLTIANFTKDYVSYDFSIQDLPIFVSIRTFKPILRFFSAIFFIR
jgi:hypothetical protein